MSTKPVNSQERNARLMIFISLLAGILGLVVLFMPEGMMLTFFVGVAAIGGLASSSKNFDERERQLLWQSYVTAFEYLFVAVYAAYAFIIFSNWLHFATEITDFMNGHWPGIMASGMCILLGIIGMRNFRDVK